MKTYRVIVSPEAFDDLDELLEFIAPQSPQNAAEVITRLWNAAQSLTQLPQRFKIFRHRRRPELAIRAMPVPPFIIYYRIEEETATVRVLTVRRGSRRAPRRFD